MRELDVPTIMRRRGVKPPPPPPPPPRKRGCGSAIATVVLVFAGVLALAGTLAGGAR